MDEDDRRSLRRAEFQIIDAVATRLHDPVGRLLRCGFARRGGEFLLEFADERIELRSAHRPLAHHRQECSDRKGRAFGRHPAKHPSRDGRFHRIGNLARFDVAHFETGR